MRAPLTKVRVVELAGLGPAPHAAMILADLGARVTRVCRPGTEPAELAGEHHTLRRRTRIFADLKDPESRDQVLQLIAESDVLIEGFRPGVAERLGLGPEVCTSANPALIYARMTGWGQDGPLAQTAGHDINFVSLTGALSLIGPEERPVPPLNLVGDYGGGSMFLVTGILAALLEVGESGRGCVIDAAMVDGTSALMQAIWEERAKGNWKDQRASNLLDGSAPFYRCYCCADGEFVAAGPIEPRFYAQMLTGLDLDPRRLPEQYDSERWPELADAIAEAFAKRSRDEWITIFEGTDACVTPVLQMQEVAQHPHIAYRATVSSGMGNPAAASAPRLLPMRTFASEDGSDA